MKDRCFPIIFSAPMVRALIAGRKTQTRRLVKQLRGRGRISEFGHSGTDRYEFHFRDSGKRWHEVNLDRLHDLLPVKIYDRLWVREVWRASSAHDDLSPKEIPPGDTIEYLADGAWKKVNGRARSPIHMPRWASRIELTITDVRVQRLREITEEDAMAEGARRFDDIPDPHPYHSGHRWSMETPKSTDECLGTARYAFRSYWREIHGAGALEANPWVAAYTFTVEVKPPPPKRMTAADWIIR